MNRPCSTPPIRAAALAALVGLTACAPMPRATTPTLAEDYVRLENELDLLPPFPEPVPQSGSLWSDGGPGAALVRDTRAFRVNDLVTVVLRESSSGSNEADTALTRESGNGFTAPFVFGSEFDNPFLDTDLQSEFSGDGKTTRSNRLSGTITARVLRVLPNGDLVVAGQKTVMVNRERQVMTLVGSVRSVDVDRLNRVASSEVGDLTVRLWGRGEIDDTVRQGWFMRMLNRIWPF